MLQKPFQDCTKNQRFLTSTTAESYLRADLLASFAACVATRTLICSFSYNVPLGTAMIYLVGFPIAQAVMDPAAPTVSTTLVKHRHWTKNITICTKCPHWLHPPEVAILSDLTSGGAINVKHSIKTTTLPFQLLRSKENNHCGFGFGAVVMMGLLPYEMSLQIILTHSGRYTMTASFHTTCSNASSWMKMYAFWLTCQWSLFPRVQLIIFQHWFREWLCANQATGHYLNQWWLVYWRIYASLDLAELNANQNWNSKTIL